jgi:signal transduction histidine kinase
MSDEDPAAKPGQGALEAYAALAAHQLGEAVALIRGATAVLDGQRARLGPGGEDALRALGAGSDRAQRFVDDLLDLARASAEPTEEPPAELDAALDVASAELAPWLERAGVSLRREALPVVALAPSEAERVFVHLLRGAVAAGAGRVQLTLRELEVAGDHVTVEVLDDGTPLGEGANPFAPFGSVRGRGPLVGAGTGLAVCRRLVERRGGDVELTRCDGRTLITLRLPRA